MFELTVTFFAEIYVFSVTFLYVYSKRVFRTFNSNGNYPKCLVVS